MTERVAHWYQSLRNGEIMITGHRVSVSRPCPFGFWGINTGAAWMARCNDSACAWTAVRASHAAAIASAHSHAEAFQVWP